MLIGSQPWTQNGVVGASVIAVKNNGSVIKFSTTRERLEEFDIHEGEIDFDPELAIEIPIRVKEFNGKVKFQDAEAIWPDPKKDQDLV